MTKSLFAFIWKYSSRQQMILLFLTVISFPILYFSLELPKRIINEVIGSTKFPIEIMGYSVDRLQYLYILCFLFLVTVVVSGVLKMYTNIFKGITAERLLRRYRYILIARIMRFPLPYFRNVSQGALNNMVANESERLGDMMGDALATPAFSAGQMLTIATFLFVQNFWLGVSAIIMIPVQAYVIPKMQRRLNRLNKERILEVRKLSNEIGESVSGVEELRNNFGLARTLSAFTARLGGIFKIRVDIYNVKFMMKFLNNFLGQFTPFLFLSVGGYLVIHGRLSVGALTAALASYKDLMAPWRALLAYYSQLQDSNLRYATILEQFDPPDMIDEKLFYERSQEMPDLSGPIVLKDATVRDPYGTAVLDDINVEFEQGSFVAIASNDGFARRAFVQALTRSVLLSSGTITIAGHDLSKLHQDAIASQIATAGGSPHLFSGSVAENAHMPLMRAPLNPETLSDEALADITEADLVGNSRDHIGGDWLDPSSAGLKTQDELEDWWLEIIDAVDIGDMLLHRGLERQISPEENPELTEHILGLRKKLKSRFQKQKYAKEINFFERASFNPSLDISENALFAIRCNGGSDEGSHYSKDFMRDLDTPGLRDQIRDLGADLLSVLVQTFSDVGAAHPIFRRLMAISPDAFERLKTIYSKLQTSGWDTLEEDELDLVRSLPFEIRAEQFEDSFPKSLEKTILDLRERYSDDLRKRFGDMFCPLDEDTYCPALSVLENILFGRIAMAAGSMKDEIEALAVREIGKAELTGEIVLVNGSDDAGIGGINLPQGTHEHIDFIRAIIRRPKVLILDRIFPGSEGDKRSEIKQKTRELLPDATIIVLDSRFHDPDQYDQFYKLEDGKLTKPSHPSDERADDETWAAPRSASGRLAEKMRILSKIPLLVGIDRKQLRLLAYGATWVHYNAGEYVYRAGDRTDGAYTFTSGKAEVWIPATDTHDAVKIATVEEGEIIGDLAVIMNENRRFDLIAETELKGLRIGTREFLDVIEHDHDVTLKLLKAVSANLVQTADKW